MQVVQRFVDALGKLGPFEPSPHLAIALSGGSDSMALAVLAAVWAREHHGRITALIVDHGLRAGSAEEALHVAQVMRARDIDVVILTPLHESGGNNVMQAARTWRYDALAAWCAANNVLHCLLGQHAGDQRETVALALARGATADGGSGMRHVRNYHGVRFLRPLLAFEKEALRDVLRAQSLTWVEDPTNHDEAYARTRVRNDGTDAQSASEPRMQRELSVAAAAAQCVTFLPGGVATLDTARWSELEDITATQLLADLVRCIGSDVFRPRRPKTLALAQWLRSDVAGQRTLGGCLLAKRGNALHIQREKPVALQPFRPAKPLAASPFW